MGEDREEYNVCNNVAPGSHITREANCVTVHGSEDGAGLWVRERRPCPYVSRGIFRAIVSQAHNGSSLTGGSQVSRVLKENGSMPAGTTLRRIFCAHLRNLGGSIWVQK